MKVHTPQYLRRKRPRLWRRLLRVPRQIGLCYSYDPRTHAGRPLGPDSIKAARLARLDPAELFEYTHAIHGTRVLARWLMVTPGGGGILTDLGACEPGQSFAPGGIAFRFRMAEAAARNAERRLRDAAADRVRVMAEKREARADFGRYIRKRLLKQGVHDDPGVLDRIAGRRGFGAVTEEEREMVRQAVDRIQTERRVSVQGG